MDGGLIGFRLAAAAAKNDLVTLKALHDSGVDVNKGDYDQRTALHLAAANGNYECGLCFSLFISFKFLDPFLISLLSLL